MISSSSVIDRATVCLPHYYVAFQCDCEANYISSGPGCCKQLPQSPFFDTSSQETILYPPLFFPLVPLAGVDWFLRAWFCCGGMGTRRRSWAKEKICFFHGNLFLVMSCAQCRREDKVQRRRILIAVLREGGRRGVREGKSRIMSCCGVDGERFVVSADFISHVKPNNREPHGLPATARPHGLCYVAHQTHQIASEMYVYNFGTESSDSEKTEPCNPGKKTPLQLNIALLFLTSGRVFNVLSPLWHKVAAQMFGYSQQQQKKLSIC